ncbi:MAG: hypothetical protein ACFE9L_14320 [Candidatus Hodarchaeota archaeon]
MGISFITGLFVSTLILFSRRNIVNDRLNYWLLAIVLDLVVTGSLSYVELTDIQGNWEEFLNFT